MLVKSIILVGCFCLANTSLAKALDESFDFTGQLVSVPPCENSPFSIERDGKIITLTDCRTNRTEDIRLGDWIRVRGEYDWRTSHDALKQPFRDYRANVHSLQLLSRGTPPPAEIVPLNIFNNKDLRKRRITLHGTISGIYRDDIDDNFAFLTICDSNNIAYIAFCLSPGIYAKLHSYLGAEITATGIASGFFGLGRTCMRQHLGISSMADIRVIRPPPKDYPLSVPYESLKALTPRGILESPAARVKAKVLGTWHGDKMIVQTVSNDFITVETANVGVPCPFDSVEITGCPETDLFSISLTHATWKRCEPINCRDLPLQKIPLRDLFWNSLHTKLFIKPRMHGDTIAIRGIIKSFLKDENGNKRMILAEGADMIAVDYSSCANAFDGIDEGSRVEVTGVCVRESEYWRPHNPFPRHKGLFLVPRSADDIVVLTRPPWWTPVRLLFVIGSLLALLIVAGVWNFILRRLVIRKGRELAEGEIARVESELKVFERTRLAVELHDSVAQNLTGASMEIRAAQRARTEAAEGLDRHLNLAAQTINSCRDELRNCLWDLRNLTIDETSVDEVLKKALQPHLGTARLSVRFNVPREQFTENTLHALVRIIRELVTNAIRHGAATEIKVAGCIDNEKLLFSVADNGIGFDPEHAPGMEEGHFGLQGIRDRIALFNGEMTLVSNGNGTKASISISLPKNNESKTT